MNQLNKTKHRPHLSSSAKLYATLQLAHAQQVECDQRLSELTASPSEMVRRHEELQGLLEAQRERALELGSLLLDLISESGDVDGGLRDLMNEAGLSFAELLMELADSTGDELEARPEAELNEPTEGPLEAASATQELAEVTPVSEERPAPTSPDHDERAQAPAPELPSPHNQSFPKIERVITLPNNQPASEEMISNITFSDPFGEQTDSVTVRKGSSQATQSVDETVRIFKMIAELPRPQEVFGGLTFTEEFAVVQRFSEPHFIAAWSTYGRKLQRAMAEHLASRLRYLQELHYGFRPVHVSTQGIEGLFGRYTDLVMNKPCGWVHGLKRDHTPQGEGWFQDALQSHETLMTVYAQLKGQDEEELNPDQELDTLRSLIAEGSDDELLDQLEVIMSRHLLSSDNSRLCAALIDHEELLKPFPQYRQLRRNIRQFKATNEGEDLSVSRSYPHLIESFKGQKISIVGADPRHLHLQRFQALLPESELEWIELSENGGTRKVDNLCESIRRGGLDVLLIIQDFISHKVTIKLKDHVRQGERCESEMITGGYGVARLIYALEQIHARRSA